MKLNKHKNKNKGKNKVHPSPLIPSSSSLTPLNDPIKTLNLLLPVTILALISALSPSDTEVLAYMLLHSLKSSPITEKKHNKNNNKLLSHCFECDCFDCYTSYWYRWDLSPHRELIHQAIEAFEEHLASKEVPKKSKRKEKNKKDPFLEVGIVKDPISEVGFQKDPILEAGSQKDPILDVGYGDKVGLEVGFENGWDPAEKRVDFDVSGGGDVEERGICGADVEERESGGGCELVLRGEEYRGLARKMLPDVIGLFNSRLWNLWGPNV